jgi:hypothetical protein
MLLVAVVILAGVVAVASGRGGEMAVPEPDYPPIDLGPVSAADVALLRPPSAAWGYNMRVTDEALEVIARAVTERDVQIAALQQQVSDLREQLGGGAWPAEADATRAAGAAEPAFPATSSALESPGAKAADLEDMGPPEYLESPGHRSELDDPLTPAEPADPEATAEPGSPAAPPVAITRPQPIYRPPAGPDEDRGDRGAADTVWDQPAVGSGPSAPWEPAQPPGQLGPPWGQPGPEPAGPDVAATAPETASAPDDHGWGTDPADTSPDAKPLDWTAASPPSTAAEPTAPSTPPSAPPPAAPGPSAGQARRSGPEPADWDGRRQPSPAPSVWDVASRQVDEDQAGRQPPQPDQHVEFTWDEDPHQTVVWGAEHARAKAARTADETLPGAEQRDDERG